MANYTLLYPPKIVFGENSIEELPNCLAPGSRVLLVTGKHLDSKINAQLNSLLAGFPVTPISDIQPEAPLPDVDRLIKTGREEKITAVVAIGGGSVLDAAKAAGAIIPREGQTADYFYNRIEITGKGLPFIALPTTAGTGTEITKNSVLLDPETSIKKSIRHESMVPTAAIIDPKLTISCSPALTAASGLDALTQAIESYTSPKGNAVTRKLARTAVKIIIANLKTACEAPTDLDARTAMAEGSMISGMAFSQSGLGAVHGLAHPIGSLLHVAHGLACAILLVPVMQWNLPECRERFKELAVACEVSTPEEFIELIADLRKELQVPETFSEINEEHFEFILANCRSNSMKSNPRHLADEDIISLLKKLID